MNEFLNASEYIDFDDPDVAAAAARLAAGVSDDTNIARRTFEFVRDDIDHCWDRRREGRPARKASEVLLDRSGWCYAKSHLLAALLRANHIPAGLCYQRLRIGEDSSPRHCLHGLNAVFLKTHGWLRLDARGNKPGVDARFDPPREVLAFSIREFGECDLPEIWPAPRIEIIRTLEENMNDEAVFRNLPDVTLWSCAKAFGENGS